MTVCIAATCEDGRTIIAATDHMLTVGEVSADNSGFKEFILAQNWHVMVSGDVSHIPFIVKRSSDRLKGKKAYSADEVGTVLSEVITQQLQEEIECRVLSPHGYKLDAFRNHGAQQLPPQDLNRLLLACESVALGVEALAVGFDDEGAHIVKVEERRKPESYDIPGFWAIGSGSHPAVTTLLFHSHNRGLDFKDPSSECVYHVLEAKFMAETVRTVGERTMLLMLRENCQTLFLSTSAIEKIRKIWRKSGAPRVPQSALAHAQDFLKGYITSVRLSSIGPFDLKDDEVNEVDPKKIKRKPR